MCGFLFTYTDAAFSQITLSVTQQPVREVIKEIERHSDYRFFYNENSIPMEKRVTVNVKNGDIKDVLDLIANQMGISYVINNNQIALSAERRADVAQQSKKVTGTVVDDLGMPVIGANVSVKGTTNGTITDMDGNFSLEVPNNAILEITYIGYRSQEIAFNGQARLDVKLSEDTQKLDEVVVVGYGTQRKGELTSSISSVKSESFVKGSVQDAAQLLQGKVAGLGVVLPNGDPAGSTQIMLRGVGSIAAGSTPLVIIDGVPGELNMVAPEDIASIDVVKDGSAAAIYGTRGNNGVIFITI